MVTGGTLNVGADSNLGEPAGGVDLNAGTLAINTAGFGTTARTVALNGGGTLDNGGNAVTFSGGISGNGGLTAAGAGTTTLSGVNTYTGGTAVTGGR